MQTSVHSQRHGFTLIELMVTVVIAGILAAVAYPNYTSYVQRSRRADAAAVLTSVVQAQERYRGNRSTFSSSLEELKVDPAAITKHYDVNIVNLSGAETLVSGYVVTATPKDGSPQRNDKDCVKMSIQVDGASVKYLATGQGDRVTSNTCWPR
ncbi:MULTISPECIES: type IV pilin protein [Roseateles]|jgi:type IV pilus assembly protein PilE|uniref:Type IV pilus assembly protein PilE n=1 Tax=Pelomonas aquatica TaxID=431058 RepID=A0ABU1ZFG1_9BURK|nr:MULTISPECIES: type IV pilin protein [Roseateles]KQY82393.1 hypothetical protein ASD35_25795 [Pelomonas sp. Root1444]MDR7299374.1 type IV pilus assembly protein PilE [Pelomonas aquatica]